ncbi:hypothetical protein ACWZHB_12570 [Nocardia sp. FBN12]|uniref:hypothetical protein n=1 Tax=Nocardia sp. FBN12 TaxID=3419766 RepID=UPI003D0709F2
MVDAEPKGPLPRDRRAPVDVPLTHFAEFSQIRKVLLLTGAPIAFGMVAGFALNTWVPLWWAMQALGALGAVTSGREHTTRFGAAGRGAVVGAVFALTVLVVGAITTGSEDIVTLGEPAGFVTIAIIASAGLHTAGVRRLRIAG